MDRNPCCRCGACCASFRVSFYWAEASDAKADGVPVELTVEHPPHHRIMRGTESLPIRCVALEGEIGWSVRCSIYDRRSTTCRGFTASWADGRREAECDKARARHDLAPLRPEDWFALCEEEPWSGEA